MKDGTDLRGDTSLKTSSNNCNGPENPRKKMASQSENSRAQAKHYDGSQKPQSQSPQTLQLRKDGIIKFTFTQQGLAYVKEEYRSRMKPVPEELDMRSI